MTQEFQTSTKCGQCGTPIYLGCACISTSPDQEKNVEVQEHAKKGVAELKSLLQNKEFVQKFVNLHTSEEQKEIDKIGQELSKEVSKYLMELKNQKALYNLGRENDDINTVKKELKKEWGQAVRNVQSVEFEDQTYELEEGKNSNLMKELERKARTAEWEEKMQQAKTSLSEAIDREKAKITAIEKELLERDEDPKLLAALNVWGRSPDSLNNRGENGKGYNAGVIHYFEYRASKSKAGRFNNEKIPFGVEGFIQYSEWLQAILNNPSKDNSAISELTRFTDNEGQERLIVLAHDTLIVCFKNTGEDTRVISSIPDKKKSKKMYEKAVETELSIAVDKDSRLNKLAEGRKIAEQWESDNM